MKLENFEGVNFGPRRMSDVEGNDLESAYSEVFGTRSVGGLKDGGRDVSTGLREAPFVQIKSSWAEGRKFLARSLQYAQENGGRSQNFIPICIGEPGSKDEVEASIIEFGGWVAMDIPDRAKILANIKLAREMILQAEKGKRFVN